MKLHILTSLALALFTAGCLVFSAYISAGEKQDKEKLPGELTIHDELTNADLKDTVRTESLCKTYAFRMTVGKTYQIDMKSRAFNSFLRLENPEGMEVALDDNSGGKTDARIIYRAPKNGEYAIFATSVDESKGAFTLSVKEIMVPRVALKLDMGQVSYQGNLANSDVRYRNQKPHKLFTFEMEAGRTYRIDQISRAFDAYLYLEDADGIVVGEDDDSGGDLNARITYKAEKAGKYCIIATTYDGGTGAFMLSVRQTSPPPQGKTKD